MTYSKVVSRMMLNIQKLLKTVIIPTFIFMNFRTIVSNKINHSYGIREGGWYGNYTTSQSPYTYECSGVPGSTDC